MYTTRPFIDMRCTLHLFEVKNRFFFSYKKASLKFTGT
jgi:hypothetical protein